MTRLPSTRRPLRAVDLGRTQFLMVFSKTLVYVTLLLIMVVQAFPLVWMILTSVKNQREVFTSFLPQRLDFSNFVRVWKAIDLPTHLLNSLYVTTLTVVIVVIVATLAGYVFARFNFRGKDWLFYIFIAAMMIPGQAILIPMFQFLKALGLLNTLTGLSLSYLGGAVAFSIFLMRAFFVSLPRELGDAAKMDGAGEWGVFWYIYLPLAKPGDRHRRHHPVDGHLERVHVLQHLHLQPRVQDHPGGALPGGRPLFDRLHRALLGADARADPDLHHLPHPAEAVHPGTDCRRGQRLSSDAHHPRRPLDPAGHASASSSPQLPLGFGGSWFVPYSAPGEEDARLLGAIEAAYDAGVRHFDTAGGYGDGHSEEIYGRFLEGRRERDLPRLQVEPDRDHRRRDDGRDRREPPAPQDRLYRPLLYPLAALGPRHAPAHGGARGGPPPGQDPRDRRQQLLGRADARRCRRSAGSTPTSSATT